MNHSIPLRPAWVEIDLAAIENNARRLKTMIGPGVELMAMVKANAYGHGPVPVSRAALRGGATWLGVYTAGEALELRAGGIAARVLVLGPTFPPWAHTAVAEDLTLTVFAQDIVEAASRAAQDLRKEARVHIKVNTGMNRLGMDPERVVEFARWTAAQPGILLEGLCTHFAVADTPDARGIPGWGQAFTAKQLQIFLEVVDAVEKAGLPVRYCHAANSPASVYLPPARLNLVRSGILMYGLHPSAETPRPEGFSPALSFKTRLAVVRDVKAGGYVSYGCTFQAARDSRIGVLMAGYADGFRRAPQKWREVLVGGQRAPIVGRVCMDQAMVDLTDIPQAQAGDEVVLIGRQGEGEITAEEAGAMLGTNNYETLTTISARVPRVYRNGE